MAVLMRKYVIVPRVKKISCLVLLWWKGPQDLDFKAN